MTVLSLPRILRAGQAMPDHVLACLSFGGAAASWPSAGYALPLPPLAADEVPLIEVWPASGPVHRYESHGYACADDGQHLFFWRIDASSADIERAAHDAYRDLRALCADSGYPQLLRIWNYFDGVTDGDGDDERYRRFCVGRHRALAEPGFERRLPAATLIGTRTPGLQLYGVASRDAGIQVENPRQTSAFRYPREYGPSSPSFSRATRYGDALLLSGTAAIVGHQTQHPHQLMPQVDAMLDNVRTLLSHAEGGPWQAQSLKLYLRDPAEAPQVVAAVRDVLGNATPLLVLQGEVCRRDLCVEIEGVFERAVTLPVSA